jgi:NADH-quinone oxidoreductase subunit J
MVAVVLFAVMTTVFLTAPFGEGTGFPADISIVKNIGYDMFNLDGFGSIPGEGFLVAFIVIAFTLDAALEGSVVLARRESGEHVLTALGGEGGESEAPARTDGGREDTTRSSENGGDR